MSSDSFRIKNRLKIDPSTVASNAVGEIRLDVDSLKIHDGAEEQEIITQDKLSTLEYDNSTSGLTATDPQAAIDEVEGRLDTAETNISDHISDTADAHDASAISFDNVTSGLTATDVQAAVDEVESRLDTAESDISSLDGRVTATEAATGVSYSNATSGLTATDVQAAIDEVEGRVDTLETDLSTAEGQITGLELALPSQDNYLQLAEQVSAPDTPASGFKRVYAKDDGKVYTKDSAGTEMELGAGSSAVDTSLELTNVSFVTSVAANALRIELKGNDGNDPSSSNEVFIAFRSSTATSAVYVRRSRTTSLLLDISAGSTLGTRDGIEANLNLYAIDSAGTIELALINGYVDEGELHNTTAEGGAGGADTYGVLYSTTARSGVAVRHIGRIRITQTTAGTWAANATSIAVQPFDKTPFVLSLNSGIKTATGNNYHQMTDNALSLFPGVWMVTGACTFGNNGSSPGYTQTELNLYAANGADSASVPTSLSSSLILSANNATRGFAFTPIAAATGQISQTYILKITSTVSVYLVPFSAQATASNSRITTHITAYQMKF